jgi:hypothetical protein
MEEEKRRGGEEGKGFFSPSVFPFPIKPDYQMRADLLKMPVEMYGQLHEKHFIFDEQYFQYVEAKLEQLQHYHELCHVYAKDYDESKLMESARVSFKKLANECPDYVSIEGEVVSLHLLGVRLGLETFDLESTESVTGQVRSVQPWGDKIYNYLQTQRSIKRLWDALALSVQEDLVIMKDDGDVGVSELMHVCFPSHWNPGERVGQSLVGLHRPVANNELLLKASKNTLQAMVYKGPFVRFVWSLNSTDELNLNPAHHTHGPKKPLGDDPSQWFFRVERQTTLPLLELKRSLFTIRIFVAPLVNVLDDERKKRLEQAVLSMDKNLLAYKGLVKQKDVLLEYLRS